ncbi:MAG: efflux RND transporter periplasmic adaptor subunit [bacterium]|nr:efflux RND transporter periplasmic adaptor subunit [bacterium]
MKRWIFILIAALAVVAAVVWWLGSSSQKRQATPYRMGVADRGTVQTVVSATGTASAVTTVSVGSQVSGTILHIYVDFNSPVKQGQVIARIDPTFLQAAVSEAEASLEKARASLSQAQRDSTRVRDLFAQNLAAQADYDNALTSVELARAGMQQAQAQLSRARTNLAYSVITSPIDGVVIARNVDAGQTVAASLQAPTLFSIAQDLHKMQIETSIDEADIGGLREGMKANFTVDSYPDERFEGIIRQVRFAAKVDQNVVTYPVIIDVDNPDLKLMPGMTANVTIVTARRDDVLRVPATALRFKPLGTQNENSKSASTGGASGSDGARRASSGKNLKPQADSTAGTSGTAYVKGPGGVPQPRSVRAGLNDGTRAEILSGEISPGDSVIVGMAAITSSSASTAPGMTPMRPGGH